MLLPFPPPYNKNKAQLLLKSVYEKEKKPVEIDWKAKPQELDTMIWRRRRRWGI